MYSGWDLLCREYPNVADHADPQARPCWSAPHATGSSQSQTILMAATNNGISRMVFIIYGAQQQLVAINGNESWRRRRRFVAHSCSLPAFAHSAITLRRLR